MLIKLEDVVDLPREPYHTQCTGPLEHLLYMQELPGFVVQNLAMALVFSALWHVWQYMESIPVW